jgi:copper/silver efflux system protein
MTGCPRAALSASSSLAFEVIVSNRTTETAPPPADAVVLAGLIPIMVGHGAGSEVMQRIAAPMVGGMVTAPLLSMFVIPAAWFLLQRRRARQAPAASFPQAVPSGTKVPVNQTGEVQ